MTDSQNDLPKVGKEQDFKNLSRENLVLLIAKTTTVHMIKSKFGNIVRSKTWIAQVNEVLCKVIAHNLCVVIQEMHELGIKPQKSALFGVHISGNRSQRECSLISL